MFAFLTFFVQLKETANRALHLVQALMKSACAMQDLIGHREDASGYAPKTVGIMGRENVNATKASSNRGSYVHWKVITVFEMAMISLSIHHA